jgi:transcription initiation factor TFIID subunit 5
MLRKESADVDAQGRPLSKRAEDKGGEQYFDGFKLLKDYIDQNLDIYKASSIQLLLLLLSNCP